MKIVKDLDGLQFHKFIKSEFDDSVIGWAVRRSTHKNKNLKIKNIIVSSKLTNATVGVAIQKKVNLIIIIEAINENTFDQDLYEVIYGNQLYVYILGTSWINNTKKGITLISRIFNFHKYSIWKENEEPSYIFYDLSDPLALDSILSRFSDTKIWVHPSMNGNESKILVENVLHINGPINFNIIKKLKPKLIITDEINSNLVYYCQTKKIVLAWVYYSFFLNEVIRELSYILSPLLYPLRIFTYFNKINNNMLN